MKRKIVVATRPSLLAVTQTKQTVEFLKPYFTGYDFEIKTFSTIGDRVTDKALTSFGNTGVFVKELENALQNYEADLAIHSLKDVPTAVPENLIHIAFPPRESPEDLFVTRDGKYIMEMPQNFICGTGSPRRMIQIMQLRSDVIFKELRGNIDTRLEKLNRGDYDAIILAKAGLNRLGKNIIHTEFSTSEMIPAISQGIISIECRKDDLQLLDILGKINTEEEKAVIFSERAYMRHIEGGCKFPLAAFSTISNNKLFISGMAGNVSQNMMVKESISGDISDYEKLGIDLAEKILCSCDERGIELFKN
ncbi:MAG: hydroxymethylbilane synthase [Candidatus Delongbacteria bacterium]|nr:hydroxymethylbilane synthase [Candidatus Delongbacteria bacterium]MBN2834654.1 hydroxymethylbilane synthase [Candidatus Delongbacteria bacterium]